MKPPNLISCVEYQFPIEGAFFPYNPECRGCIEVNHDAVEEYRLYLAREARDRRIGCIGVVIAAALFWTGIISAFVAMFS